MRKLLVSLSAAGTLLFASSAVRADNIPWGYSAADTTISANSPGGATSTILFKGSTSVATGNSGIVVYNLTTTSAVEPVVGTAEAFNAVPFTLGVTVTDITSSGKSGAVSSGAVSFGGTFSASNVSKSSLLPGAVAWTTPTEAVVTLGTPGDQRTYTVDIGSFTPPGQPGGAPGSIQAIVHVAPGSAGPVGGPPGGTPPPDAPEPASLVLAGLALPALLVARRRKKAMKA